MIVHTFVSMYSVHREVRSYLLINIKNYLSLQEAI